MIKLPLIFTVIITLKSFTLGSVQKGTDGYKVTISSDTHKSREQEKNFWTQFMISKSTMNLEHRHGAV